MPVGPPDVQERSFFWPPRGAKLGPRERLQLGRCDPGLGGRCARVYTDDLGNLVDSTVDYVLLAVLYPDD